MEGRLSMRNNFPWRITILSTFTGQATDRPLTIPALKTWHANESVYTFTPSTRILFGNAECEHGGWRFLWYMDTPPVAQTRLNSQRRCCPRLAGLSSARLDDRCRTPVFFGALAGKPYPRSGVFEIQFLPSPLL